MKLLEQISESILTGNINIKPYYSIKKDKSLAITAHIKLYVVLIQEFVGIIIII